jgi:hypothetical protein
MIRKIVPPKTPRGAEAPLGAPDSWGKIYLYRLDYVPSAVQQRSRLSLIDHASDLPELLIMPFAPATNEVAVRLPAAGATAVG